MRILGIGGSVHDFASCLIEDGRILIAIEDERITRQRYGLGAVSALGLSSRYCLRQMGMTASEVDLIVVNDALMDTAYSSLHKNRLRVINHHLAHAASAFFPSPFEEAAILVIDNEGSKIRDSSGEVCSETITYGVGRGNRLEVLGRVTGSRWLIVQTPCNHPTCILKSREAHRWIVDAYKRQTGLVPEGLIRTLCLNDKIVENSVGGLYLAVTRMIGMGCMDAGKTMALASYGTDRFYPRLRSFVQLGPEGDVRIRIPPAFVTEFKALSAACQEEELFQLRADLAWAAQQVLEDVLFYCANYLHRATGLSNLCIAGGCGLNCQANGKLLRAGPFSQIFVQPASADNGTALGAAFYGYHVLAEAPRHNPAISSMQHAFLGGIPDEEAMKAALHGVEGIYARIVKDIHELAARAVAEGKVVGWYRGASEFGPRALGNRSILADPRRPEMKDFLNNQVKLREPFRPFAPAVLIEAVSDYFELERPSPFMLFAVPVRRPEIIPAVVHIDGTARVQTVDRETNPDFYRLIAAFADLTNVPVILNTSFNLRGEPIVESPHDAVKTFMQSRLDALALGDIWVTKG